MRNLILYYFVHNRVDFDLSKEAVRSEKEYLADLVR